MNNLLIDLSSRYFSRYPCVRGVAIGVVREFELGLKLASEDEDIKENASSMNITDRCKFCGLILLFMAFAENDKHLKKKLLKYLRDFMQETREIHPNASEYTCFVLSSFNYLINFVVENMIDDININSPRNGLSMNGKEENKPTIEKYINYIQYILNDVFEMLLSSAGSNDKDIICSNNCLEILFEGISNLDLVIKRSLISIFCIQTPDFENQVKHLLNGTDINKTKNYYVEVDQQLLLYIISILNRISSIVINYCDSISSLAKYLKILLNMDYLNELDDDQISITEVIDFIFYRILCANDLNKLNKDLITSIGMFSSLLYISEQIDLDNTVSDSYMYLNSILEHTNEHVERFEFSNVCQMSFYRGLIVYCSMIYDITRSKYHVCNYEVFKISFHKLVSLIVDYRSEENSAYGLQSLLVWISRFKNELINSDAALIKSSVPCFYLNPISDIILPFLDQPIIYYSKLANQILEEFVDYLIILDHIFQQEAIEEIGSDPLNWFIDLIFNNVSSNKYKFLSIYILFNGILNSSKSNINGFNGRFCKLSKIINFNQDQLNIAKSDSDFIGVQLLYYLVFSLSIHNTSSSSQNLIFSWFNLRKKILLREKNADEQNRFFLDFILNVSIQIIKRGDISEQFEKKEMITSEGKSYMFARLLQILKKADRKYYYDKLPFIFDSFFKEALNQDHTHRKELNFIHIQILVELKRNERLLWEDEIYTGIDSNKLGLTIVFNDSPYFTINGCYYINSLISNNSDTLSQIVEFLSLTIKLSIKNHVYKNKWLINEMESLYIIICNIKPINVCSGVLSRIISIFEQIFDLINKLFQKRTIYVYKTIYYEWLKKIFIYLNTSIGLHVSTDKVDFYLPILCSFLETFSSEDYIGNFLDDLMISNKCSVKSFVPNLHSQLFSSSNYCRNLASDLLVYNPRPNFIFNQFHNTEEENVYFVNHIFSILKESFNKIRSREYNAFNILIYYYMKKVFIDLKYQRENLIALFKKLFNFLDFEYSKPDNIYFFIGEAINLEINTRLQHFYSSGFDVNELLLGNNSIPLQSIINLFGISFKAEFIHNSTYNFIYLCETSLKMIYIFTLILFILTDTNMLHNFSNEFDDKISNRNNCFELQADFENLNYSISRVIDEICNLFKIMLTRIDLGLMFETSHKPLNLTPGHSNTQNVYLDEFLNHLYTTFVSEKSYCFAHRLCIIYINFIFKCDHPGNSENLLETFSAILNSVNVTNILKDPHKKHTKTKNCKLPLVKINILINNEAAKIFNRFILSASKSIINQSISNSVNKIPITDKQTEDLSKNLLLHIIYSLLSIDKHSYECNKDQFTTQVIGDFILDYEKIDIIFDRFVGNRNCKYNDRHITPEFSLDINQLFPLCGNSINNAEKLYIPSPKRKSNNLCKIISILVSAAIRDSKFHQPIKYIIKLLIVSSLNNTIFHRAISKLEHGSDHISHQEYKCSIHSNHILATLISKSKSGSGMNNLCEIFDLSLLCGSLFSAVNNIKMYDTKVKDENGFTLCNSSLNLMSALLKRFSLKANGIESNIEYISNFKNQSIFLNNGFKGFAIPDKLSIFFGNIFREVMSITLNMQINSDSLYSLISEMNASSRFSLKSITRISRIFEPCIIDMLLNSNDSQFQGMILLLLSEISISWSDCSFELAICIIKSIYSRSYFVRMHSSKLLAEIILRTLDTSHSNVYRLEEIPNTNIDETLFKIFVNNSINKCPKVIAILELISQSIKTSNQTFETNKNNLIHGVLNLGIELLRRLKDRFCFAFIETEACLIYEDLLNSIRSEFINSFTHSLLRLSSLELMSLLLDLEFSINEKYKFLEYFIYYWKNSKTISRVAYLELSNLSDCSLECIKQTHDFVNESLTEPIYLIKTIVNITIKYVHFEGFNSLVQLSPTLGKIIHPKILSEFYLSIIENLYTLPEANNSSCIQLISNSINDHLNAVKHVIFVNIEEYPTKGDKNRIILILMEIINVLIECLSTIALENKLSHAFLDNEHFFSILENIINLIYDRQFLEYNYCSWGTNLGNEICFRPIKEKNTRSTLDNRTSMLNLSVFLVRYYKNITKLYNIPDNTVNRLERIVFDHFLKMIYRDSMLHGNQVTLENKLFVCNIIQTIFESLESELSPHINAGESLRLRKETHKKTTIHNNGTILELLLANHDYWYNLMICLIYLMTDEAASIESKATRIFYSFHHIIKYFCSNFLKENSTSGHTELNFVGCNNIEQLILVNDQNSCMFSIYILDAVSSSVGGTEFQSNSILFPKELDNICNEYLNISQIATRQIMKYLDTINQVTAHPDSISSIESYFELWERQVKKEFNLFEKVYNCVKNCPSQLIPIELYGNILADEIHILLFVLLTRKLEIISMYKRTFYRENIFENTVFDTRLFEERINFLLSNVHENCLNNTSFYEGFCGEIE